MYICVCVCMCQRQVQMVKSRKKGTQKAKCWGTKFEQDLKEI